MKNTTTKTKYAVSIPEVHIATIYIEAESEEEAMTLAEEKYAVTGEPDEPLEFSHSVDQQSWEVYEVKA